MIVVIKKDYFTLFICENKWAKYYFEVLQKIFNHKSRDVKFAFPHRFFYNGKKSGRTYI
jgi:hypothetical protein